MIETWKVPHIIKGMLTYAPMINAVRLRRCATGGSSSSRYCYAVWLRHLVTLDSTVSSSMVRRLANWGLVTALDRVGRSAVRPAGMSGSTPCNTQEHRHRRVFMTWFVCTRRVRLFRPRGVAARAAAPCVRTISPSTCSMSALPARIERIEASCAPVGVRVRHLVSCALDRSQRRAGVARLDLFAICFAVLDDLEAGV